jgi:hypothetical protein
MINLVILSGVLCREGSVQLAGVHRSFVRKERALRMTIALLIAN